MVEWTKRRLQTPKKIKGLVDRFYKELYSAPQEGRKVAWCVGPVPFAPLRAMGIHFLHTENYGARLAARQVAQYPLKAAFSSKRTSARFQTHFLQPPPTPASIPYCLSLAWPTGIEYPMSFVAMKVRSISTATVFASKGSL